MAGLLSGNSVNRGVRRAGPGMRRPDETMFAPREDGDGPKGPNGDGFGAGNFRDDMEFGGGPDTAPMPNPGKEGDQPNVSPQEQAQYTKFVDNGLKVIFDRKTVPGLLKRIKAGDSPAEGLASSTVMIVTALKDSAERQGQQIDDAVLLHGGQELMENIAELSNAAKVHTFTPDEIESAMYSALDQFGTREMERGTLDKEKLAREFQTMMDADKAGKIDDVIPGLSQRAREIEAKRGKGGRKPAPDQGQDQGQDQGMGV